MRTFREEENGDDGLAFLDSDNDVAEEEVVQR